MPALCATSTWLPLFPGQCAIKLIARRAWDEASEVNGYRIFTILRHNFGTVLPIIFSHEGKCLNDRSFYT